MVNHEENLKKILETQKSLALEIQELTNSMQIKREQYLKLQGIAEYLSQTQNIELNQNEETNEGGEVS